MNNELKIKVEFEISQIDKLLSESQPLQDLCKFKKPDFIELSAAAMVLHSFYNGIENIIVMILKDYREALPIGYNWHMELLEKTSIQCGNRKIIFNKELKYQLEEYRKFRHLVRHIYNYKLNWAMMEDIMNNINTIWEKIKENLNKFLKSEEENNLEKPNVV